MFDLIRSYWTGELADKIDATRWVTVDVELRNRIFGQHIAIDEIKSRIYEHLFNKEAKKALVIICNGSVGTGKTFFGKTIANYGFRNGTANPAVKIKVGPRDYPDPNRIKEYKKELMQLVETTVKENRKGFFLFDEADKMPSGILDCLTSYVDYHESIDGIDYRKSIFMFLSNTGGSRIEELVLQQYSNNLKREDLLLYHFQNELKNIVLHETGGLQNSDIIRKSLIDHYVPFLPLEKFHIASCLEAEYVKIEPIPGLLLNMNELAERLEYGPTENKIFSIEGAKNVVSILRFELERRKRRK